MQGTKESIEKSLSGNEKTPANTESPIFAGAIFVITFARLLLHNIYCK